MTNRPRITLRTLYAIPGAFGGTSPIVFIGRALARAAMQEARWALRRWRKLRDERGRRAAPPQDVI